MKAAVISIGNELLLGKTLNSNLAFLGGELSKLGIPVEFSVTIQDNPAAIHKALQDTWNHFDVVITTGGLGPTEDDLTKAAIAEFFGKKLHFDEAVWSHVQGLFAKRNLPTPQLNRCQALVPDAFVVLENQRGTAPGLHYQALGKHFFALQGVPLEMRYIFENRIVEILRISYPQAKAIYQKTLHTHGISESRLAELFTLADVPSEVQLAWLPQTGRVDLRFYGYNSALVEEAVAKAVEVLQPFIWSWEDKSPAEVLYELLWKNLHTISVAESCSGGWLGKLITDIPGASNIFRGGVIAYANEIKEKVLKVDPNTLTRYGAVSETCALEMAKGIKELTKSSHAISVTGIAGPEGGSAEKPVGTVYFGFIADTKHWTNTQVFTGDRDSIRLKATEFAILELIKDLQGRMD